MEQCWNGLCFWSRSIEWIWVECAQYAYQWDGLSHDGWKEEHFVLEILIQLVIMCILYYCYIWLWYRKLYEKEWEWMGMWLVVISKSDSISIIHSWKWMSNPANIVLMWVWIVIRHMFYIKWIIVADKNRVINRVDQYCELQWIFVWLKEWCYISSVIFIPQHFSKPMSYESAPRGSLIQSLNHSIICYWFLSLMKVRLIDWLTYCVIQRIVNEPIHEWINDAHCMQWITIIRLL